DGLRGSWGVFRPARGAAPAEAREAITRVQVLERLPGATLLACELETGRQHQIRIHLAEAGHPLVGETLYIRDWRGPLLPAPRPMLHASVLGFVHPRTEKVVRFEEPPPEDFAAVLKRLRGGKIPPLRGGPSLPQPPLSQPPPRRPGERGLEEARSCFFRQTSPSSPGGRGGGWEKRAGVMRVLGGGIFRFETNYRSHRSRGGLLTGGNR
ncbi:MAG: pseudouridine synthase, partial [Thermoanaerobaculia bacterium]